MTLLSGVEWRGAQVEEGYDEAWSYQPFWYASVCWKSPTFSTPIISECTHHHRTEAAAAKCLERMKRRLGYVEPARSSSTTPSPDGAE